jgi:hypothetical protein
LIEFPEHYRIQSARSMPEALHAIPTSLLAHEMAHLTHTMTTAAGFRQFAFSVEELAVRMLILEERARADPVVPTPLLKHLGGETTWEELYAALVQSFMSHRGSTVDVDPEGRAIWLEDQMSLSSRAFVNLELFSGERRVIAGGQRHLTEGFAKIIERMQRRFHSEAGEFSPLGTASQQLSQMATSPLDPYYVSLWVSQVCHNAAGASTPHYEEYVLILSDLAMMLDPLFTPNSLRAVAGREVSDLTQSPFSMFFRLCDIFWAMADTLPPLSNELTLTDQVCDIQNAILDKCGAGLTMKDIATELHDNVAAFFDRSTVTLPLAGFHEESLRRLIRENVLGLLSWRRDTLQGSAIIEDLLTGRETLMRFITGNAPSVAVGETVYSNVDVREGWGIGAEQASTLMLRDVLDAAYSGDRPCMLQTFGGRRTCARQEISLCTALPRSWEEKYDNDYCARTSWMTAMRALGVTGFSVS